MSDEDMAKSVIRLAVLQFLDADLERAYGEIHRVELDAENCRAFLHRIRVGIEIVEYINNGRDTETTQTRVRLRNLAEKLRAREAA